MEVGGDKIKYLDITISLEECNNFLTPTFGIFRKPSFTGLSIHSSSLHPRFHKSACATSAIHQMLSISLNSAARLVETVIVKQIVAVNHLDINVVSTWSERSQSYSLLFVGHFECQILYESGMLQTLYYYRPSFDNFRVGWYYLGILNSIVSEVSIKIRSCSVSSPITS